MAFVTPALQRAFTRKRKLIDSLGPLPARAVANLSRVFSTEFTYNAIEGDTLTLRETRLVIEEGQTAGGKSLREAYEARNHPGATLQVESLASGSRRISGADLEEFARERRAKGRPPRSSAP